MKITEAYQKGIVLLKQNHIEDASLKVKMLIENVLHVSKEYIMIYPENIFPEKALEEYLEKLQRLIQNEPIQYILQKQEFYGLSFYVDENVLIPQPDTEILVEEAIQIIKKQNKQLVTVLDLCTGSGAIAISLAKNLKNLSIIATDISVKALEVAQKNAIQNHVDISFIQSDLFQNITNKVDIIVSNPPYIETETIKTLPEEVKKEPRIALDGGEDGLVFYKKIIAEAKNFLHKDGYLILEMGYHQKKDVENLLKENGYTDIYVKQDLGHHDRVVIAKIR